MKYTLMNAEHEILAFERDGQGYINITEVSGDFDYAPVYFCKYSRDMSHLRHALGIFLSNRAINSGRSDAKDIFAATKVSDNIELSFRSLGLSLCDRYWYRPSGSGLTWKDVNCFDREYDTSFGEALLRQDYTALSKADPYTPDCTIDGITRKAWLRIDGSPMLLKSEEGTSKFIEQSELLSAVLTDRLLDEDDYVAYTRLYYEGKSYIACRNMIKDGEELVQAQDIHNMMKGDEAVSFKFMTKDKDCLDKFMYTLESLGVKGLRAYFARLAAVMNLSLAGDCHLHNFGFIRDLEKKTLRAAPLYDRGRSFGSFGKPVINNRYSCAEYALESPRTIFIMMLFHSAIYHSDWDFSWYEPQKLDGFEDDIDNMLGVCEDIPKEYIEMLKTAFLYQLADLNKAAGKY